MAVPWSNLIPQRSRVLPQGGAILGQLTGTFQSGLEQGRMRAAEDQAPDLLLNYLETQGQGYQPTLGNLATPAAGYVGGQQAPPAQFDGRPTISNAQQQQAAAGGVDAGVQLLDQFEGFRATPYEDWSYRPGTGERYMSGMRIGYGQTIPGAQNITQEQAQAALRQQIEQQYIPSIVGTVGADTWGRLNPDQQGVLISLAHNYGSIPGRIVPALQSGDSAAAASAIAALGGDNSGINQRRREQEAMAFAGTGQPMAGGAPSGGTPATGGGSSPQPAWSPPTGAERAQLRALMINPATRQMGYQLAIQRMTPPEPVQPNWQLQEFNGTLYRVDANTGQAQPVIQGQPGATGDPFTLSPGQQRFDAAGNPIAALPAAGGPDREMREDANGILRYVDTQEPVFPAVQAAPEGPNFGDEESLRDNFRTETGDYRLVQGHYERLAAAAENPSAAGDIAMVFAFMKMLDPASVVRETEYATAANAAGVPTIIANTWNRIRDGERLAPEQRADFIAQAQALFGATQQQYDATVQRYTSIARQYGMDPSRIFGAPSLVPAAPTVPPPPATDAAPAPLITNETYRGPNGEVLRFDGTRFVDEATGVPLYNRDGTPIEAAP